MLQNLDHTSQKTCDILIIKITKSSLFREIFAVYYENYVKHINILYGQGAEF
jgi:hypothetical protein